MQRLHGVEPRHQSSPDCGRSETERQSDSAFGRRGLAASLLQAQLVHHVVKLHKKSRQRGAFGQPLRQHALLPRQQRRQLAIRLQPRSSQRRRARLQVADAQPEGGGPGPEGLQGKGGMLRGGTAGWWERGATRRPAAPCADG